MTVALDLSGGAARRLGLIGKQHVTIKVLS
jgi:rare lipoprotein A (peptidoglycan hydrolase)